MAVDPIYGLPKYPVLDHIAEWTKTRYLRAYQKMLTIRVYEDALAECIRQKRIPETCHLYAGQEAVAVGVSEALNKDDLVFGTYRSHGYYIARGGDLRRMTDEIFQRENSSGRRGSMHVYDSEVGILGSSAILGGSVGLALGAATAEKLKDSGRVVVGFHGDGASEEGIWYEACNIAALKGLPLILVCENNLYGTQVPISKRRPSPFIAPIAKSLGMYSLTIDGNSLSDVYFAARRAVTLALNGQPVFIEALTWRKYGHYGPGRDIGGRMRQQSEDMMWALRDPIEHFRKFLVQQDIATDVELDDIAEWVRKEVRNVIGDDAIC